MSDAVRKLRRCTAAIRPAEWVVLLFGSYLIARIAQETARSGTMAPANAAEPRLDILCAALTVVACRQVARFARTPWPEDCELARPHWVLFPFTGIGLLIQIATVSQIKNWGYSGLSKATSVHALFALYWLFRRFGTVWLPLLLLWLGLGLHIKKRGRVIAREFLRESFAATWQAARDWAPPLVLVMAYGSLGDVLSRSARPDMDTQLKAFDRWLFLGHSPSQALQAIVHPAVSEWMVFCYSFYAVLFALCFGVAYAKDRPTFQLLAFMITLTLACGYVGYTFMPAMGPAFTEKFQVSLDPYYFGWVKEQLLDAYRVPRDCFPSLHTAISLVFLVHARQSARWLYRVLLPIVVSIPLACVYLRYHYVADLLAGGILAAAVLWAAPRIQRWHERESAAFNPAASQALGPA
jgi:membrane-associated phospholipid phosphatase